MKRLINVEIMGDFDIRVTDCIMEAPEGMSKKTITAIVDALEYSARDDYRATNVVKELKRIGFKLVNVHPLKVGRNV